MLKRIIKPKNLRTPMSNLIIMQKYHHRTLKNLIRKSAQKCENLQKDICDLLPSNKIEPKAKPYNAKTQTLINRL